MKNRIFVIFCWNVIKVSELAICVLQHQFYDVWRVNTSLYIIRKKFEKRKKTIFPSENYQVDDLFLTCNVKIRRFYFILCFWNLKASKNQYSPNTEQYSCECINWCIGIFLNKFSTFCGYRLIVKSQTLAKFSH